MNANGSGKHRVFSGKSGVEPASRLSWGKRSAPHSTPAAGTSVAFWGTFAQSGSQHFSPATMTLPAPVAEVASSNATVYALLSTGAVYAWGNGNHGQLGNGKNPSALTTPVKVKFPAGVKIASIPVNSGPWDTAYAIDTTGHVWGWGANGSGDLCLGNSREHSTPAKLPFDHVTAVAGAADHTTYDAEGTLYSCGMGLYGELGDGSTKESEVPVRVKKLSGASVTELLAGFGNIGALLSNGNYYDWGLNSKGQLGNGTVGQNPALPVKVTLPHPVRRAFEGGNAPGDGQTLVLLSDGSMHAWGAGRFGAVGDGTKNTAKRPVEVESPASALISSTSNVVAVALRG